MHLRIAFCLLLAAFHVSAQTPPPTIPAAAQRYLSILMKRPQPGTIYEIAGRSGLDHVAVARRISELRDKMKLVVDSGLTRPSPKGRACTVWRIA
jgi:predicted ArsR family transcriptional regulator